MGFIDEIEEIMPEYLELMKKEILNIEIDPVEEKRIMNKGKAFYKKNYG